MTFTSTFSPIAQAIRYRYLKTFFAYLKCCNPNAKMISNLRPSRAVIVRSRYRPATLGDVDDRRCRATMIGGDPDEVTANTSIVCMSTFRSRRPSRQRRRSAEHTSELQSLMRISYDVFCL